MYAEGSGLFKVVRKTSFALLSQCVTEHRNAHQNVVAMKIAYEVATCLLMLLVQKNLQLTRDLCLDTDFMIHKGKKHLNALN